MVIADGDGDGDGDGGGDGGGVVYGGAGPGKQRPHTSINPIKF